VGIDGDLIEFGETVARFIRQGGVFGWTTFCCLSEDQQEVAARIADEVSAVRAVQAGRAARSAEGGAAVLSPFDDGDAAASVALARFMEREA